jgi:acyl transferase domain-containing protein/acyl carrier protein
MSGVRPDRQIAIVGMSCRFPGASSVAEYWDVLISGRDTIGEVPIERYDAAALYSDDPRSKGTLNSTRGGFVDGVEEFDAAFFGIAPREAVRIDPQQRMLLESAYEAVEDAGLRLEDIAGTGAGVYTGACLMSEYWDLLREAGLVDLHSIMGAGMYGTAAGRISHALDLHGPSMSVDATCATAMMALQVACQSLRAGETDLALVSSVSLQLTPYHAIALSRGTVISPDGRSRFGDSDANGYVRSEGVASMVLKRLSDAVADGDRIHAVIAGIASSNDGRSGGSLMTPSSVGQELALRGAYRDAGISPADVDYVEAHGTGTVTGDRVELRTLGTVLGDGRPAGSRCLVGSAKSNVGHLEPAAGMAGLIKTVLALRHGIVPATLHVRNPLSLLADEDLPLELPTTSRPWPTTGHQRIAGVSAFGISGSNSHVVLLQAPDEAPQPPSTRRRPQLLPVSARAPKALARLAELTADRLDGDDCFRDIAYSAGTRRSHHRFRMAVAAEDASEAAAILRAVGEPTGRPPADVRPKVVFVFSGQGSHWTGMARDLLQNEPVFRARLAECDAAVRWELGFSPLRLIAEGQRPAGPCQVHPTLWAVQVALAAVWQHWGVRPDELVGQSIGEIAAATVSGVLTVAEGAAVTCRRAKLLAGLDHDGGMALVRLAPAPASAAIGEFAGRVSVGAINGVTSTALSGDRAALATIVERLRAGGVPCWMIDIDFASHSTHMEPLRPALLDELAGLRPAAGRIPMWSTVTGERVDGSGMDAEYWADNLCRPVQLAAAVRAAAAVDRPTLYVEISTHPLLLDEIEQVLADEGRAGRAIASTRRDEPATLSLLRSAGAVYAAGCELDWHEVNGPGRYVDLPTYPWQRKRFWVPDVEADAADTVLTWDGTLGSSVEETLQTAVAELLASTAWVVEQTRVVRPLPGDPSALTVRVTLRATRGGWQYELCGLQPSPGPARRWCVYSTGRLTKAGATRRLPVLRVARRAQPKPHEVETLLVEHVTSLLALPKEEADPSMRLSALGLDSLMAARLRTQLSNDLGIPVSLGTLLSGTPIGELAAELSRAVAAG